MNTNLPAIEPVTDEDYAAACATAFLLGLRPVLEQDRRRVAERQANHDTTHAEGCASWGRGHYECAMVETERLRAENTHLRTLVAVQATPCVYCGLTEMAKCTRGFPGCARADDLICGEEEAFKAVVSERNTLRAEVARLKDERADCEPFLKEGERLDECLERWRTDATAVLDLLVKEKKKSEALEAEVARLTATLNGKENSDA